MEFTNDSNTFSSRTKRKDFSLPFLLKENLHKKRKKIGLEKGCFVE